VGVRIEVRRGVSWDDLVVFGHAFEVLPYLVDRAHPRGSMKVCGSGGTIKKAPNLYKYLGKKTFKKKFHRVCHFFPARLVCNKSLSMAEGAAAVVSSLSLLFLLLLLLLLFFSEVFHSECLQDHKTTQSGLQHSA